MLSHSIKTVTDWLTKLLLKRHRRHEVKYDAFYNINYINFLLFADIYESELYLHLLVENFIAFSFSSKCKSEL